MVDYFVVLCSMEGCHECSDTTHVVGVFKTKKEAETAEKEHNALANPYPEESKLEGHFHYCYVYTEKVEMKKKSAGGMSEDDG